MDINHLKNKFIDEAESLLTNFDNILIDLEKTGDLGKVNEVFRIMHTIKGASGMFGFDKVVEITHELESIYDLVRENMLGISPQLIELTFSSADHIRALLADEAFSNKDNIKRHKELKKAIDAVKEIKDTAEEVKPAESEKKASATGRVTWSVIFYPSDELVKRCVNMSYTFHDLFILGDYHISNRPFDAGFGPFWTIFLVTDRPFSEIEDALMFVMDYCKITRVADFDIFEAESLEKRDNTLRKTGDDGYRLDELNEHFFATETPKEPKEDMTDNKAATSVQATRKVTTRINVEASKLDTLMYLVSELVTAKSELLLALKVKNEIKAIDTAEKIEKLSKQFSDNALSIRMVPLEEMLNKFKRLIRDLAKQLGKKIDFQIIGEDTELDKNIIDTINETIMHLIRNCVDHGIETPEKRKEIGKSETGVIKFEAHKAGNYIYITISDDGSGIDSDLIYRKAREKGFINEGVELSREEILNLIFLPGFSTAESLSNVSGRGVGMDVVLKRIQELRGEIAISSSPGSGTAFIIKLQQTVSIINTLLVKANNITYAIPIEDIESCLIEQHCNISGRQNHLLPFGEELIPYFNLSIDELSVYDNNDNARLIVIKRQAKHYAIVAEAIIGEFQAVIKPLGKAFSDVKYLSGASLLGDGSIALLLDTEKLWHQISKN